MRQSFLSFGALASLLLPSAFAAPTQSLKKKWDWPECTAENIKTRVDFDSMEPCDRKAYTDAILCMMNQPSQLDPTQYPAAINRYFDYAVIHVGRTAQVHLSGYFSTWHRYFLWLFEQDLINICGYEGAFPYWNFALTAEADLHSSAIFDGSEYSMSGDGYLNDTGPIILGPSLIIPHGTGGGCVTSGPFAYMETTLANIDPSVLLYGYPINASNYDLVPNCLTRDLNQYVAQMYTNSSELTASVNSPDAAAFELSLNGVIGGSSLGIHSAGHFTIGGPMDSIHVSPQDPVWYPLHTMIDNVYTSWQIRNPAVADTFSGTMTALNIPPSANVTGDSIMPDWGYLQMDPIMASELLSTTAGPFCYQYDVVLG